MEFYRDVYGNQLYLTFDPKQFIEEKHVLVLPFYKDQLIFTKHRTRGIELPGGKIEEGETALAAAVREVYEEIGAALSAITLIGQYVVERPEGKLVKSIYTATVARLLTMTFDTDTDGPVAFAQIPTDVMNDPAFSPFMKDGVYIRTLQYLGFVQ